MTNSPILSDSAIIDTQSRDVTVESANARSVAEIQSSLIMARKYPRQEAVCFQKIAQSLERLNFAEKAVYSFPRSGIPVQGPSAVLARELSRLWGNMWHGTTIIHDDDDTRTVQGWAWDLETNTRTSSESTFKKLVYRKQGGWVTPDERDLRELTNKHAAICERNAILQLIPNDIVDDCVAKARFVVAKKIDNGNIEKERANILAKFDKHGIVKEDLEAFCGFPLERWSGDVLADLSATLNAIKDGQMKKSEIVRQSQNSQPVANLGELLANAAVVNQDQK